jgi:hypothetical protein
MFPVYSVTYLPGCSRAVAIAVAAIEQDRPRLDCSDFEKSERCPRVDVQASPNFGFGGSNGD